MERLMIIYSVFVTIIVHFLGFSDSKCPAGQAALYKVTFQGLWSKKTFYKHYPLYRPPAQWSKIIGRTHTDDYNLFKLGKPASYEFKEFMETGRTNRLDTDTQGEKDIRDIFMIPKIITGIGDGSSVIIADSAHSMVSLAAKLIPSPDWFVGLNSLDLCEQGEWLTETTISLFPLDGGTQRGLIFSSPKWPERIPRVIQEIQTSHPSHPASSFFYREKKSMPPIATITVKREKVYGGEVINTGSGQEDEPAKVQPEVVTEIIETMAPSKDCEVAEWSEWTSCSKTCGFGRRGRKRQVIRQPGDGGVPCPAVAQNQMCGGMKGCSWSHFSSDRWKSTGKKRTRIGSMGKRRRARYPYKHTAQ